MIQPSWDHMNRFRRTPKEFTKYGFVSPRPHIPTRHHENCLPPFFLQAKLLIAKVLEEPIPAIERKKLVICLEATNLTQIQVVKMQSLIVWMIVSSPFPQL
jgi:hypothetical protein